MVLSYAWPHAAHEGIERRNHKTEIRSTSLAVTVILFSIIGNEPNVPNCIMERKKKKIQYVGNSRDVFNKSAWHDAALKSANQYSKMLFWIWKACELCTHLPLPHRPEQAQHGRFAGYHQGQTGTIIIVVVGNNCKFAFFLVVFFLQADWSQRPVLKSNLQTPTWLLLISHELFITAITSPCFLSSSSTAAGHPFSLFLHLADLTSFPPSPTPSFDLRPSIQSFFRSFPHTILPSRVHYFLPVLTLFAAFICKCVHSTPSLCN